MSIIYVPRLIETAEQAEALPVGTVALLHIEDLNRDEVAIYHGNGGWGYTIDECGDTSEGLLEWCTVQALVPIEAEEETGEDHDAEVFTPTRRLVTPWESD